MASADAGGVQFRRPRVRAARLAQAWAPAIVCILLVLGVFLVAVRQPCSDAMSAVLYTRSPEQRAWSIAGTTAQAAAATAGRRASASRATAPADSSQPCCVPDLSGRSEDVLPDVAQRVVQLEAQGRGKKVIAVSLYGANPRYTYGAVENAWLVKRDWPGWTYRVYFGEGVPADVLTLIRLMGGELVSMVAMPGLPQGRVSSTFWRFLAFTDTTVTRVLCRDADARPTAREKAAVQEWMASEWPFHSMHDHQDHGQWPLLSGMIGAVGGLLHPRVVQELFPPGQQQQQAAAAGENTTGHAATAAGSSTWYADQDWLESRVWPLVRNLTLEHASFHCGSAGAAETRGFPTQRLSARDFVGNVYQRSNQWQGETVQPCPAACRRKPKWDMC